MTFFIRNWCLHHDPPIKTWKGAAITRRQIPLLLSFKRVFTYQTSHVRIQHPKAREKGKANRTNSTAYHLIQALKIMLPCHPHSPTPLLCTCTTVTSGVWIKADFGLPKPKASIMFPNITRENKPQSMIMMSHSRKWNTCRISRNFPFSFYHNLSWYPMFTSSLTPSGWLFFNFKYYSKHNEEISFAIMISFFSSHDFLIFSITIMIPCSLGKTYLRLMVWIPSFILAFFFMMTFPPFQPQS